MLLLECEQIKKYYGDRLILGIDQLKIYSTDRIGIVGANGAGKTTLLDLLSGRTTPDSGQVKIYGSLAYITQLAVPISKAINKEMAGRFKIPSTWHDRMSGGEKNKFKFIAGLEESASLLCIDEPTSHVDLIGRELMEQLLKAYRGALVLISHDRCFLNNLCHKIIEVEIGKIKIYPGDYDDYRHQKAHENERKQVEYKEYVEENKRLKGMLTLTEQKSQGIKKAPSRMGNSEARLHKMGDQRAKANLDGKIKHINKRIKQLEIKEKPLNESRIKLQLRKTNQISSKILLKATHINKSFGDKVLFRDAEFTIYNRSKIALIGPNGCGKSTLVNMLLHRDISLQTAPNLKIGYFSQDLSILDPKKTIFENVEGQQFYSQTYIRRLLAGLLFDADQLNKSVRILSGGEQVKVALAKVLLQDVNLLILDEPANYLDILSLEVIEAALRDYPGNLLLVSHDRQLINAVADHIMTIEDHKLQMFNGNYQAFQMSQQNPVVQENHQLKEELAVLNNHLSAVIGRLSSPTKHDDVQALEQEYQRVLARLKQINAYFSKELK